MSLFRLRFGLDVSAKKLIEFIVSCFSIQLVGLLIYKLSRVRHAAVADPQALTQFHLSPCKAIHHVYTL